MSKYLERKIRIYFECYEPKIDIDALELIKESEIVNGVLILKEQEQEPKFRDIRSFSNENTDKE